MFIHGEVDIVTAPEPSERVHEALDQHPEKLTLDLTNTTFMECAELAVIASALRQLPERDRVVLRRPQPIVRFQLEASGMDVPCTIED